MPVSRCLAALGFVLCACGSDAAPAGDASNATGSASNAGNTGGRATSTGGSANSTGGKASGTGGSAGTTGGAAGSTGGSVSNAGAPSGADAVYGDNHTGQYHLGPVDFAESEWHNACAPQGGYRSELHAVSGLNGEFLAGVSNDYMAGGAVCDSCILVETGAGKSAVLRVVTYGVSNAPGDLDVSPSAYAALSTGEYPRSMSWRFAKCPDTGKLRYEFQTEANVYWTSFWLRNQRVPVTKVEVKSAKHANFVSLRRELDGTLNDDGGFGEGAFTLRITGMDGQVLTETQPGFSAGQLLVSTQQFE